ncbi:DUF6130 family protein [Glacieibacterium megasporae]|uniref:DUF6130 family protein n=1 Tax=Glacieibacterium megasporae TaxID=2835787 RepID=UPI001CAA56D3|nr:DUF6130 family protein [Polymorphobacter megasporae]UAJ12455.1 DUF6130 family protein [Polymorphobacter megasporae]
MSAPLAAQTARDILGAPGVVPLDDAQPAPRLIVDPPVPGPLSFGRVVIQYRAENLRITPTFGPKALEVSPRIGHIHVTVDDLPWHWADASGEPLIMNGMPPGKHKVLIELVDSNHKAFTGQTVEFIIPVPK